MGVSLRQSKGMSREPVLSGEIPHDGVIDVLREIEQKRITGKIRYLIGDESGEVELSAGQIALDQDPLPSGADPVEAVLAARSGMFAVHALLPPLAVSQGDEHERRGSLAVHVPADLMTYCEQAGLTGSLEMRNAGKIVEVVYEFGELLAIRIDGREQTDLAEVFAWDEGSFRIELRTPSDARSRLPEPVSLKPSEGAPDEEPDDREPTVRFAKPMQDGGATGRFAKTAGAREDTGAQLLRMVEVALTDVVSTREKARASLRSTPPKPSRSVAPPRRETSNRRDATVRVVWLGGEAAVAGDLGATAKERDAVKADEKAPEKPRLAPPARETPKASRDDEPSLRVSTETEGLEDAEGEASEESEPAAQEKPQEAAVVAAKPGEKDYDTRWVAFVVLLAFAALIALHFLGRSH